MPVVPAGAVGESKGREAMPSSSVMAAPQPNTRHGTACPQPGVQRRPRLVIVSSAKSDGPRYVMPEVLPSRANGWFCGVKVAGRAKLTPN